MIRRSGPVRRISAASRRLAPALAVLLCAAVPALPLAPAAAAGGPAVTLSAEQGRAGGRVTVSGSGWRPHALLTLLVCGQRAAQAAATAACANAEGRTATTDARGAFRRVLPVADPPAPCPCVVRVATVLGTRASVDTPFRVTGHATEPGRLTVTATRLTGAGGLLTWFGAPPARQVVVTVRNPGAAPVTDPAFRVGTSHGVFTPRWSEQPWQGTVRPGSSAEVTLPAELTAGAHGDYTVSVQYGGKVLATAGWRVPRPWGMTLFWLLLACVVPTALYRAGMAVVERVQPRARPRHAAE